MWKSYCWNLSPIQYYLFWLFYTVKYQKYNDYKAIQWLIRVSIMNQPSFKEAESKIDSWQWIKFFRCVSYFPCVVWEMYHVNKPGLARRMRRVTGTDVPGMSVSPVDTSHCTDHASQMLTPIPLLHRIMNK